MTRTQELLREAARALEDMRDPMSTGFLVEHNVTADECFDLSETMALAIRVYLRLLGDVEEKTPGAAATFGNLIGRSIRLHPEEAPA